MLSYSSHFHNTDFSKYIMFILAIKSYWKDAFANTKLRFGFDYSIKYFRQGFRFIYSFFKKLLFGQFTKLLHYYIIIQQYGYRFSLWWLA